MMETRVEIDRKDKEIRDLKIELAQAKENNEVCPRQDS